MSELSARKSETILVGQASGSVLELVVSVLENANFVVLQAKTGVGAVELAASYTGKIDLLLLDLQMHGMSGPAVGDVIKLSRPNTHLMFMSSYDEGQMLVLNYGWAFIEKQFVESRLLEMVNIVLHSPDKSQGSHQYDKRLESGRE
jgi:CheY-like chemotaxis protein